MNPLIDAKQALETRLAAAFPTVKIAYEGASFKPPAKELYLACQMAIGTPDEPTIGDLYYREVINWQVFVVDVNNRGTTNALQVAQQVRDLFDKGLTLTQGTTNLHITKVPQIAGADAVNDRIIVPVLTEVWVEVYK